jgi:hypothetical protein
MIISLFFLLAAALLVCKSYAFTLSPSHHLLSSRDHHVTSKSNLHQNPHHNHRNNLQLKLSTHPTIIQSDVIDRLELTEKFDRWRFLQKLLENELSHSDIEDVLLLSLSAYLQHGPTPSSYNNKDENGGNASPVLSDDQRTVMNNVIEEIVSCSDGIGDSRFLHLLVLPPVDYECLTIDIDDDDDDDDDDDSNDDNNVAQLEQQQIDKVAESILTQIEQLLPDPIEDEEAYKSSWDVVIDLYGRESVRVNEEGLQHEIEGASGDGLSAENLQWRTLSAVGRVLIHYDFLTKGVLKEGTFR